MLPKSQLPHQSQLPTLCFSSRLQLDKEGKGMHQRPRVPLSWTASPVVASAQRDAAGSTAQGSPWLCYFDSSASSPSSAPARTAQRPCGSSGPCHHSRQQGRGSSNREKSPGPRATGSVSPTANQDAITQESHRTHILWGKKKKNTAQLSKIFCTKKIFIPFSMRCFDVSFAG